MIAADIRAQIDRILSSSTFSEAERARRFLIVEMALTGRSEEIKETVIGIEALGRPASFDPRTDPIVRVEAGRLRARLVSYYHAEGAQDPIIIVFLKVATFLNSRLVRHRLWPKKPRRRRIVRPCGAVSRSARFSYSAEFGSI